MSTEKTIWEAQNHPRTRTVYANIADIKRANKALGHYFFEPDTMRFFNSRVGSKVYGGRYFITSEQREPYPYRDMSGNLQPATERRYTIREAMPDGSISTVGDFHSLSKSEAKREAKRLAS